VEIDFPAGATVAYDTAERDVPLHEQIWVLSGTIEVTAGTEQHRLDRGDCLAVRLDQPMTFHNPGTRKARYAVVVVAEPGAGRRTP
jgi:mannose-6-phosphate isomerase-like protein (cupin superfamily)